MRTFPRLGNFLIWLLWPYIVARKTDVAYFELTGNHLPKDKQRELRKSLAGITSPITNPVPRPSSGAKTKS